MVSPETLRRYPFFAGLTDAELAGIAMLAHEVSFAEDEIIFNDGELASHIYELTSGAVELVHTTYEETSGGQTTAAYVGSIATGEPFGISAFVEPFRLSATARTVGQVKAIKLDATALRAMSEVDCHLGYTLMRQIAQALGDRLRYARVQLAACKP